MMYSVAQSSYRWLLSRFGQQRLAKMLDDGLPSHLRQPLLFLLTKSLSPDDQSLVNRIEARRAKMANDSAVYVEIYPSPDPGSSGPANRPAVKPQPGKVKKIALSSIAEIASVVPYWGAFLYLCSNATRAETILELGSCAGISGCYMAAGKNCKRYITIEGSHDLARIAESNLGSVASHFEVINALFDSGLDRILPMLTSGLDMVHVDGQHEKIATFHYLTRLTPFLNRGALLVFDDIRWTPDMWEAWQTILTHKGFAWTLDTGRYGLCLWDGETDGAKHFDFSRYADLWRAGKPREQT